MLKASMFKAVGVILALIFLGAALASAFDHIEIGTVVDYGDREREILNRTGRWSGNGDLMVDSVLMGSGTIFEVQGVLGTSYLRTNAYSMYNDGKWTAGPNEDYRSYDGTMRSDGRYGNANITVSIVPKGELHGQLVTVQRTGGLFTNESVAIEHSDELDVYRTPDFVSGEYHIAFNNTPAQTSDLRAMGVIDDGSYLQVPEELRPKIEELARFVVQEIDDPLEQAKALSAFLQEHYDYSRFYSETPANTDEVEWFLFSSKNGQCTHFNSALVLMARSIGLPARICSGYLVDGSVQSQNVTSLEAHAYTEVRFGVDTWIIFDATPATVSGGSWEDPEDERGPSLYGFVYEDRDGDKTRNFGEPALGGWTVMLLDKDGIPVAITTSVASSGLYTFDPTGGDYTIKAVAPEGYIGTTETSRSVHIDPLMGSVDFGFTKGGSPGTLPTETAITTADSQIFKGQPFAVEGRVSASGEVPSDSRVVFYLAPTKTSPDRTICGETYVSNGAFATLCMAPDDLELSSYQLIARFVGAPTLGPSESDPQVELWDQTIIEVKGTDRLIAELGGTLTFSVREAATGRVVPFADLAVDLDGPIQINTGVEGEASLSVSSGAARTTVLSATYGGSANLMNSSYFSPLQIPALKVDVLSADLVRNGTGSIIGRAYGGEAVPPQSLEVEMTLPDQQGASGIVPEKGSLDRNGLFVVNVVLSPDVPLTEYDFSISVGPLRDVATVVLNVTARPVLVANSSGDQVSLLLTDDRGTPLPGRSITLDTPYSSLTVVTDAAGRAATTVQAKEDCNCTITFIGEANYLGASTTVPVTGTSFSGLWVALVPAVVIPAIYLLTRKVAQRGRKERLGPSEPPGPYDLTSPQVPTGLPLVWEPGTPLSLLISGGTGALSVGVDGVPRTIESGEAFTLDLPEGDHQVIVSGPLGVNVHQVRFVEYRSEIARLYIDQVIRWCQRYEQVKLPMAPREVQSLMAGTTDADRLEAMVTLFEAAQYSMRPTGRGEYEAMYWAVKGVGG